MTHLAYSTHADTRMNQRGMRKADIELILRYGTAVTPDRFCLKKRDVNDVITRHRREIQQLERLRSRTVVVNGDVIVTCF